MARLLLRGVLVLATLSVLAACDGLKSCSSSAGVVIGGLFSSNWSISCSASYEELSETEFVRIELEDIGPFVQQVQGQVGVSVETGTAVLSFYDGTGFPVSLTATKGAPALYAGSVQLSPGPTVRMELSPVGDPAENVRYEVTFAG